MKKISTPERHLRVHQGSSSDRVTPLRPSRLEKSRIVSKQEDDIRKKRKRNSCNRLLPMSANPNGSPQILGEKEIRHHFDICIKLFAENKINVKNAWSLQIIDYLFTMAQSSKFALQIASSTLSVSTKVYEIRVDDIHADGLKLAANIARAANNAILVAENNSCGEAEEIGAVAQKRKRRKHNMTVKKSAILSEESMLLGDIPKVKSAVFQTEIDTRISSTDNFFTSRLFTDHSGCKFTLLGRSKYWQGNDENEEIVSNSVTFVSNPNKLYFRSLCPNFADFEVNNWELEKEEMEHLNCNTAHEELIFKNGIPQADMDGSIHDIFEHQDDLENNSSGDEDQRLDGEIIQISELRPVDEAHTNDYTYHTIDKNDQILWAGPSHWKLKNLQCRSSKFSGACAEKKVNPKKRRCIEAIDFSEGIGDWSKLRKLSESKIQKEAYSKSFILPLLNSIEEFSYDQFMMKEIIVNNKETEEQVDELDNRSDEHCSQEIYDYDDIGSEHEDVIAPHAQFIGDNLIDLPDTVPKMHMQYAPHAKRIDMKKLKHVIWRKLVHSEPDVDIEQIINAQAQETTFKEIYHLLPSLLSKKMAKELSRPLAFISILQLANEHNLKLVAQSDLKDFKIEQDSGNV